jgi:HPt (histidine-containing phosphotransfer) domain-containing protein
MLAAATRTPGFSLRASSRSEVPGVERPIDLVHLARQTDGDEQLEAELLGMFDRQSEKLAERVKLTDLSRRARGDIAHRLRGSALAIGAGAVARAAQALEEAFESDGGEPEAEIEVLGAAVAAARAAIAQLAG